MNADTKVHNIADLAEMCGDETTETEARMVRDALIDLELLDWVSDRHGGTLHAMTDDAFYAVVASACAPKLDEVAS
jgi:hypothetical protein